MESSLSRRLSIDTDGETASATDRLTVTTEDSTKSLRTSLQSETIPESPRQDAGNRTMPRKWGALSGYPSANTEKPTNVEEPHSQLRPGDSKIVPSPNNGKKPVNGSASATKSTKEPVSTTPAKQPAKLGISATGTVRPAGKSPTAPKTPTGSALGSQKHSYKTPDKMPSQPGLSRTPKQATTPAKAAGPSSGSKKLTPAPVQLSPPSHDRGIGFIKPKVKSPTRPVKLPASLTAPTASSVSKFKEAPRESLSRASGNIQMFGRSSSRASVSTVATTGALKRQKSVIHHPRPSVGPPPRKRAQDYPVAKNEKEVDEGFLARMMRPTQSSSSKEKDLVVTPPRKQAAVRRAPVTREAEGSAKKESPARKAGSPKQTVPPQAVVSVAAKTEKPAAVKIAPAVAKTERAEETMSQAKKTESAPQASLPPQDEPIPEVPAPATPTKSKLEEATIETQNATKLEQPEPEFQGRGSLASESEAPIDIEKHEAVNTVAEKRSEEPATELVVEPVPAEAGSDHKRDQTVMNGSSVEEKGETKAEEVEQRSEEGAQAD